MKPERRSDGWFGYPVSGKFSIALKFNDLYEFILIRQRLHLLLFYVLGIFLSRLLKDAKVKTDALTFGNKPVGKVKTYGLILEKNKYPLRLLLYCSVELCCSRSLRLNTKRAYGTFLVSNGIIQRRFYMDSSMDSIF